MNNDSIVIENLSFSFNKERILNNLDLNIEKGDFLSILGASGSGKSTFLRVISNILPSSRNELLEGDVSIFGKTPKEYLDSGKLSFMFQEASLMPNLNVRNNIGFPLKLRGLEIESDFIDELLGIVGLKVHQNKYPSELSGGMKTRVSLARAFVTKPEVLLLDEPFSALDISWRYELYEYLDLLSIQYKTTVILVTHDIQESILLGDKVVILSKSGKILEEIKPIKNAFNDYGYESVNKSIKANTDILLDIQTKIIVDGVREDSDLKKANNFADFLINLNPNEIITQKILDKIQIFKKSINDKSLFEKLLTVWNNSNSWKLKHELMWRLLDSSYANDEIHKSIYDFIVRDFKMFVRQSKEQKYFQPSLVLKDTSERLNNTDYPSSKDWLYLVYLKAMTSGNLDLEKKSESLKNEYISKKGIFPYVEFVNKIYNLKVGNLEK